MDQQVQQALARGGTIDITTTGRKSGQSRRIEIWFHTLDDRVYITGLPGRRDWYANLLDHPAFIFHLKDGVQADLAAEATPITDAAQRRAILERILPKLGRAGEIETWITNSPLVAVTFDEA
jgi:deazaflavin-dependent oxidoreductase (nitroreductase family)